MHFTCLSFLDLTGNSINQDASLFSLATIPALQTLILNNNNILHIPKFRFGFEALCHLSLNGNKIESAEDLISLTDLEQLEDVSIIGNPLIVRVRSLNSARASFASSHINLKCCEAPPPIKTSIVGPLRTVKFDPLTLPSFTAAHTRALNRRIAPPPPDQSMISDSFFSMSTIPLVTRPKTPPDDVFMTSFESKMSDDAEPLQIEPTPLPAPDEAPAISSVWGDVPVLQLAQRVGLTARERPSLVTALRRLEFLVAHPEIRLRPREATSLVTEPAEAVEEAPDLLMDKPPPSPVKPSAIASKLAARTEYTKAEIQGMLRSMEERLELVERELQLTDESGQAAVDIALDQKNFAVLHKQYETIRAELINTLTS